MDRTLLTTSSFLPPSTTWRNDSKESFGIDILPLPTCRDTSPEVSILSNLCASAALQLFSSCSNLVSIAFSSIVVVLITM